MRPPQAPSPEARRPAKGLGAQAPVGLLSSKRVRKARMNAFAFGAFCAALVTAAAPVPPAPEAPPPPTVELPPVVVPAPPPEPEAAPDSARRRDPSGSVTVIRVSERPAEARDLAELCAQAPGVLLRDLGGLGQT